MEARFVRDRSDGKLTYYLEMLNRYLRLKAIQVDINAIVNAAAYSTNILNFGIFPLNHSR